SSASCSPATGSTASDCRSGASAATRSVDREPDLDGHLPVRDLPALDVPAGLQHLEPADVAHALRGRLDRDPVGVVTARLRRAGQFQGLVDVVAHGAPPSSCDRGRVAAHARVLRASYLDSDWPQFRLVAQQSMMTGALVLHMWDRVAEGGKLAPSQVPVTLSLWRSPGPAGGAGLTSVFFF